MNRAVLVYMTLFIGVAFLATPRGLKMDLFMLADREIHLEDYCYYLWQHGIMVVLFHVIHVEAKNYKLFFQCAFWYQVIDLLDYILNYNSTWFNVGAFPISCNTVSAIALGIILIYESCKDRS
jgi:hypothetical protein